MININDRHRLHQFLMIHLAIRYLEIDLKTLEKTKCTNVFIHFTKSLLKQLNDQYFNEKRYFSKKQVQLIGWKRIDAHFSRVTVATPGEDAVFKYANQAVKMHIEELIFDTWKLVRKDSLKK